MSFTRPFPTDLTTEVPDAKRRVEELKEWGAKPPKPYTDMLNNISISTMNAFSLVTQKQKLRSMVEDAKFMLREAKHHQEIAWKLREEFAKEFGDAGFPNRFPISGGICGHWPEEAKDAVAVRCYSFNRAVDGSFRLWGIAGKRRSTWLKARNEILGR